MMTTDTTKPRPNARSQLNNSGYRLRALPPLADLLSDQETASRFFSSKPYPLPKHLTLIKNPRAAEFPGRQVIFWNEKDAAILSGRDAEHDANKQVMAKKKHTQTGEEKISHIVNDPLDKKIDAAKAYLMVAREQSFRKLHEEHPEHGYWRFGFDTPDWWPQDMEREVTRPKNTHIRRGCAGYEPASALRSRGGWPRSQSTTSRTRLSSRRRRRGPSKTFWVRATSPSGADNMKMSRWVLLASENKDSRTFSDSWISSMLGARSPSFEGTESHFTTWI